MTNPGQLETGYYVVLRNAAIANLALAGFSSRIEKRKVIKEEYRMSVERNVSVTVSQRVLITQSGSHIQTPDSN